MRIPRYEQRNSIPGGDQRTPRATADTFGEDIGKATANLGKTLASTLNAISSDVNEYQRKADATNANLALSDAETTVNIETIKAERETPPDQIGGHAQRMRDRSAAAAAAQAAAASAPTVSKGPRNRTPESYSLLEYFAHKGGLKPDLDLQHIFDGNPFIPGFGRLIRKGGMTLDEAWEHAIAAKYILDPTFGDSGMPTRTGHRELFDLIDREARGEKQFIIGYEKARPAAEPGKLRHEINSALDNALEASA